MEEDTQLTAIFKHQITVTSEIIGQGTINIGSTDIYAYDSYLKLEPAPVDGWEFYGWYVNGVINKEYTHIIQLKEDLEVGLTLYKRRTFLKQ